jgi:short-subunit dehydrogenase
MSERKGAAGGANSGKGRALVTGASGGIGRELARAFASRGYDLILAARNEEALAALAQELGTAHAVRAKTMAADISVPGAAEAIFEALERAGVAVEILVNNAGIIFEGDFASIALENHLRLLQINVVALTSLTHLFLPAMIARGGGRILNVASIAAFMPVPRLATYAAAKAYVLSLTESLSQELSGTGVTATALCPGLTDTAMVRGSHMAKVVPAPMIMSPKEVAELGCTACLKGETICVPGLANRALTSGVQLLPRALVRSIGGMATIAAAARPAPVAAHKPIELVEAKAEPQTSQVEKGNALTRNIEALSVTTEALLRRLDGARAPAAIVAKRQGSRPKTKVRKATSRRPGAKGAPRKASGAGRARSAGFAQAPGKARMPAHAERQLS